MSVTGFGEERKQKKKKLQSVFLTPNINPGLIAFCTFLLVLCLNYPSVCCSGKSSFDCLCRFLRWLDMVDGELLYAKRLLQTLHSTSVELSVHTLANLHTQLFLGVIGYLEGIQLILKKNQAVRKSEIDIICNN